MSIEMVTINEGKDYEYKFIAVGDAARSSIEAALDAARPRDVVSVNIPTIGDNYVGTKQQRNAAAMVRRVAAEKLMHVKTYSGGGVVRVLILRKPEVTS